MGKCPACKAAHLTKLPLCRCPAQHWVCPMCGRSFIKWFDEPMRIDGKERIIDILSKSKTRKLMELRK